MIGTPDDAEELEELLSLKSEDELDEDGLLLLLSLPPEPLGELLLPLPSGGSLLLPEELADDPELDDFEDDDCDEDDESDEELLDEDSELLELLEELDEEDGQQHGMPTMATSTRANK